MLKNLKNVWYSWTPIVQHLEIEFCQTTNTSDFKLECVNFMPLCYCTNFKNLEPLCSFNFMQYIRKVPYIH